jgi:hypothetical protein
VWSHKCEEDIVSLFHLLLAPTRPGNNLEVEQYQPVGRACVLIATDGRDVKVVNLSEEYPEKGSVFFCFLSR